MPSGWGIYYVVFLSAVLALGIPGVLSLFSSLARRRATSSGSLGAEPKSPSAVPQPTPLGGNLLGQRMNARFFQGMNAALILITCGILLIPCVGLIRDVRPGNGALLALILLLSLCAFAFLALIYASRKGDLEWLSTFKSKADEEPGAP